MRVRELARAHPGFEVFVGGPARVDEVAVLAEWPQQLERLEPRCRGDSSGALGEPLFELRRSLVGHGHRVDDHDRHCSHPTGFRRTLGYTATRPGAVSSVGRAPARQAGGHWFEPSTAHIVKALLIGPFFCLNSKRPDRRGNKMATLRRDRIQSCGLATARCPGRWVTRDGLIAPATPQLGVARSPGLDAGLRWSRTALFAKQTTRPLPDAWRTHGGGSPSRPSRPRSLGRLRFAEQDPANEGGPGLRDRRG